MALPAFAWKLASPYDAYVSHVARLADALGRIRDLSTLAVSQETSLNTSLRLGNGNLAADIRLARFRERLGRAAAEMTAAQFEEFLVILGNGNQAIVEDDRARAVSRLQHTTRGLEEYFAIAAREIAVLEQRGFNPGRGDVARQLRQNRLPGHSVAEYQQMLHDLGSRVGKQPS